MSSNLDGLYKLRDYKADTDKAFVKATFLNGLYYGESWFSLIPKNIFFDNYKLIVDSMLDSPNVVIKVACQEEDEDVILGYSILSADYQSIIWVYVKDIWRKQGVAKALTPEFPVQVTHLSALGKIILAKKFKGTIFNPFYRY